jgi:hypothetical protein
VKGYLLAFEVDDEVGDEFTLVGLGGLLGGVEDGGSEGVLLDAFGFEVFDQ